MKPHGPFKFGISITSHGLVQKWSVYEDERAHSRQYHDVGSAITYIVIVCPNCPLKPSSLVWRMTNFHNIISNIDRPNCQYYLDQSKTSYEHGWIKILFYPIMGLFLRIFFFIIIVQAFWVPCETWTLMLVQALSKRPYKLCSHRHLAGLDYLCEHGKIPAP